MAHAVPTNGQHPLAHSPARAEKRIFPFQFHGFSATSVAELDAMTPTKVE